MTYSCILTTQPDIVGAPIALTSTSVDAAMRETRSVLRAHPRAASAELRDSLRRVATFRRRQPVGAGDAS